MLPPKKRQKRHALAAWCMLLTQAKQITKGEPRHKNTCRTCHPGHEQKTKQKPQSQMNRCVASEKLPFSMRPMPPHFLSFDSLGRTHSSLETPRFWQLILRVRNVNKIFDEEDAKCSARSHLGGAAFVFSPLFRPPPVSRFKKKATNRATSSGFIGDSDVLARLALILLDVWQALPSASCS